jgi:signal transduction histidine kinase
MADLEPAKFPSFPLTRYFFITGLLVAFVPVLLGGLVSRDTRQELTDEGESLAKEMADGLTAKIAQRFRRHYDKTGASFDIRSSYAQRRSFESWLATELKDFDTEAVTFVRWDGSVSYSSRESQRLREWREDPFFQSFTVQLGMFGTYSRYRSPYVGDPLFRQAMDGTLTSTVNPRESWGASSHYHRSRRRYGYKRHYSSDYRGRDRWKRKRSKSWGSSKKSPDKFDEAIVGAPWERAKHFMLEVYVPVTVAGIAVEEEPETLGVLVVQIELGRLVKIVHSAAKEFTIYFIVGILTLMLALYLWIRKAEKTINDRTGALVSANQQLRAFSEDLEKQVEERTRQLVQTKNLASLGQLSTGIAHEVCNPVASIASCAEGLLKSLKSPETLSSKESLDEFDEYLKIIRDEAFRVKDITRNLLDFSRRGQPRGFATVDLRSVLGAMGRLLSHRLDHEEKQLILDLGDEAVTIHGDDASLRQMVLNITLNAIDASEAGHKIRWSVAVGDAEVVLSCEDEGLGFLAKDLDGALEPFHTGKAVGQGTGLGLSIADSVARQHGGRIELSNREDCQGARVTAVLAREAELSPEDDE